MQVIPALDLCGGLVVHAKKGERNNYMPIVSRLCASATPFDVINGILKLHTFRRIYVADLDALQQRGNNVATITSICQMYPQLEIWLDTGLHLIERYLEDLAFTSLRLVLSTESLDSVSSLTSIMDHYARHDFLFSIDYKAGKFLGPQELLKAQEQWPQNVLALNLDRVGTGEGINLPAQLHRSLFQTHSIYYGGGIKNIEDLYKLKTLGAAGALLTTALHDGTITEDKLVYLNKQL